MEFRAEEIRMTLIGLRAKMFSAQDFGNSVLELTVEVLIIRMGFCAPLQ